MIHTDGKRRRTPRSVEQCEREIQRLQASLDGLRSQIGEVELSRAVLNTDAEDEEDDDDEDDEEEDAGGVRVVGQGKRPISNGDTKMRSIISRYDSVAVIVVSPLVRTSERAKAVPSNVRTRCSVPSPCCGAKL